MKLNFILIVLVIFCSLYSAQQTITATTHLDVRTKANANFTELYAHKDTLYADIDTLDATDLSHTASIDSLRTRITIAEADIDTLEMVYWEDLRFPATQTKQGATTKPDFDYTNVGLLFPKNDTGEKIYIVAQMPHAYKYETNLRPHIHFVQTDTLTRVFKISYRWVENGDTIPDFTLITSTGYAVPYTSGSMLQIIEFPEISGTGKNSVSSCLDIVIYRDDNLGSGDVLVKEFDIHYQTDSRGSLNELSK